MLCERVDALNALGSVASYLENRAFILINDTRSPDGTRIAAGDDTGTINVWQVGDSTPFVAGYRRSPVHAVAWSPNRDWITSVSDDGAVQIWDVQTGVNIITYRQP